ncbi:pyrroloquinoline quinone biosynthesis peptide chaperone PqqD [Persicimonas caeni]|uniref:Pyrroloquinoline quinone biosynthesis peptide chaperone PqqD n=1 Tax=Persicimonas caeni TaxID=2292766 RepID=A0A4Y6PXH0_PERCE|nr:pyrroloquinoline quinone biosynthesis peptide chaperone PqqD [Persicimonas caeni]QDG53021.1 pyrroloquinoline quinone biosynthesis peptide chaperone PqqD [Persicimonas caeni]QED34243.1 pyrroloquinoline quinone biosynthesis peptide chaperone PqqD [Persicimonas caeni]
MTRPTTIADDAKPALAEHVRWREDKSRDRWVIMGPERLYVPDAVGRDILRRVDGQTSFAELIDQLTGEYDASRAEIARDVRIMLEDLVDKGIVTV